MNKEIAKKVIPEIIAYLEYYSHYYYTGETKISDNNFDAAFMELDKLCKKYLPIERNDILIQVKRGLLSDREKFDNMPEPKYPVF